MRLFKILTWPLPFKGYIARQMIALDQMFNTAMNGDPDETYSSRMGRDKAQGGKLSSAVCDVLSVFEKDHCEISIEADADGNPAAHHLSHVIHEMPASTARGQVDKQ